MTKALPLLHCVDITIDSELIVQQSSLSICRSSVSAELPRSPAARPWRSLLIVCALVVSIGDKNILWYCASLAPNTCCKGKLSIPTSMSSGLLPRSHYLYTVVLSSMPTKFPRGSDCTVHSTTACLKQCVAAECRNKPLPQLTIKQFVRIGPVHALEQDSLGPSRKQDLGDKACSP